MSTAQPEDWAFLSELAREIVGEVAPEEIEIFDELVEEYYRDPTPPDLEQRATDDALGFGLGEMLAAATPAVIAMTTVVFGFAVHVATQILVDESAEFTRSRIKGLLMGKKVEPVPFRREHLIKARQLALEEAKKYGMVEDDAQHMADSLLRRMMTESQ